MSRLKKLLSRFTSDQKFKCSEEDEKFFLSCISAIEEIYELDSFEYKGKLVLYKPIRVEKIGYYSKMCNVEKGIKDYIYLREEYNAGSFPEDQEHTFYFLVSKIKLDSTLDYNLEKSTYTGDGILYGNSKDTDAFKLKKGDLIQFFADGRLEVGILFTEASKMSSVITEKGLKNHFGIELFPVLVEVDQNLINKLQNIGRPNLNLFQ